MPKKNGMPYISVNIHFVWATKNRHKFLDTIEKRLLTWQHIKENALKKGIFIDRVGGHAEHCHCLISLRHTQTISKTMQLVKGESAHWLNKEGIATNFEWQNDYYAESVSKSALDKVRAYIDNQEKHHESNPLDDELKDFGLWLKP